MSASISRVPSCPICTIRKLRCLRDPTTNECGNCEAYYNEESNRLFYVFKLDELEAQYLLYREASYKCLSTLDVHGRDFHTLVVYITSSTGKKSGPHTFDIAGPFTIDNNPLTAWLASWAVENFALPIHGIDESVEAIRQVVLVGSLLHFLCSTVLITEKATSTIDGFICDNLHEQQSLGIHLRYLVFCLLKRTLDQIMGDVRIGDWFKLPQANRQAMFTGMAVLQSDMRYFRRNLQTGNLSRMGHLSPDLMQFLINGLLSVETELDDRLCTGCAQFLDWQDFIQESTRKLRRVEKTFALSLSLHQVKFTDLQPQQSMQVYTPRGSGDDYLLSALSSPIAKFAGLTYDIDEGMEQLADHVSDSLSTDDDEEAAVLVTRSLFPGLCSRVRLPNHEEMM